MSYIEENQQSGRIILPDLVRAFALFGIVLVNVAYFAYPAEFTYSAGGLANAADHSAYFAVNSLFLFKSYTLFSFMFGVGLAYQMISAERRGASFAPSYFRRMLGLILLGMLHVTVGFVGDILIIYGVLGIVLYWFRNASQKVLMRTGIALVVLQILISALFAAMMLMFERFEPEEYGNFLSEINTAMDAAKVLFATGKFSEIAAGRWQEWKGFIAYAMPSQAPGVFGFFLLGLAGVRAGVLENAKAALWSKARKVYLPIGLLVSVLGSVIYSMGATPMSVVSMLGTTLILLGAPLSSVGYIGLMAKWSEGEVTPVKAFFARGGTSSLTTYLLQSLILSFIFCGYGLGLYAQLGAAQCILIALVTGVVTISFSSLWRTKFKRGPMEELLRRWTYLRA